MSASYRAESDQEPVVEAAVSALLPATRQRLAEAFRREEALAYRRPVLVDHPVRWLLAGGVGTALMMAPPLRQFGHIDGQLFAAQPAAQALLMGSFVWGFACGTLGLRSMLLRRGGLPEGVHLFASCLLEVEDGRLRVWPISRLRAVEPRERVATLDLGPDGRLQLTTDEKDLGGVFAHLREQLTQARLGHDSTTVALLDPVHAERERGSLRPVEGTALLPSSVVSTGRIVSVWLAVAAMITALSALLVLEARYMSDLAGIERARRGADIAQLKAYVSQEGPLTEQADVAWFTLCKSDAQMLEYLRAPYARHHLQVNALLSERLLERTSPDRLATPLDRKKAIAELRSYFGLSFVTLYSQPELEQRAFELSIAESDSIRCNQGDDPLRAYLGQSDARGERAREAQWRRVRQGAELCGSFEDLETLRSLATTPARQDEFRELWRQFFERQRQSFDRSARQPAAGAQAQEWLPEPLIAQVDEVWAYVSEHPDLPLRSLGPSFASRRYADDARDRKAGWVALMAVRPYRSEGWNRVIRGFSGNPMAWQVNAPDEYLLVQEPPRPATTRDDQPRIESTLILPGGEPRKAQYMVPSLGAPERSRRPARDSSRL